ncbi:hypothetical protein K469DRAFT_267729 [Zopfia rhizophila CBS 207.26]|uniref:Ig-like domain-containing protein n=1 Tax=Zopfia rhizophila CBS 207.26 TaxID=1314779 RepID=A0A6A6DRD2_9PEZI|nr:hypothetical protein K469DRAFT_267729 [Zopfia rhizophila CBS 207.26]
MLPFTTLLFLAPLIRAQSSNTAPSQTTAVHDLIPPYGAGPATYYASVIGDEPAGTVYAITCLPPTTFPTPEPGGRDPCMTNEFGNSSQTFTQGKSSWSVTRMKVTGTQTQTQLTLCEFLSTTRTSDDDDGLLSCYARGYSSRRSGDGYRMMGLKRQDVTITAGLEKLGTIPASTSGLSFTDIGATPTIAGPVATVTLHKIGGNAGTRLALERSSVIVAMVAFAVTVI